MGTINANIGTPIPEIWAADLQWLLDDAHDKYTRQALLRAYELGRQELCNQLGTEKGFDSDEIGLLIMEVYRAAWGICDASKLLKDELEGAELDVTEKGTTPFAIKMLLDAIYRIGSQQNDIALKLGDELGVDSRSKRVRYGLFDIPGEGSRLSEYLVREV